MLSLLVLDGSRRYERRTDLIPVIDASQGAEAITMLMNWARKSRPANRDLDTTFPHRYVEPGDQEQLAQKCRIGPDKRGRFRQIYASGVKVRPRSILEFCTQANRIEPIFKEKPYAPLVPKAVIKIGAREVNLLDAGHRSADAVVRFSTHKEQLSAAFRDVSDRGDARKLAKLAPTSLIFGVWDSRIARRWASSPA